LSTLPHVDQHGELKPKLETIISRRLAQRNG